MGTLEKLEEHIRRKPIPRDISIDDIKRLLESKGFTCILGGNNHLKASHPLFKGVLVIAPPHAGQKFVKFPYVKQVISAIDAVKRMGG